MIDNKKIEEAAKQHAAGAFISEYWQACYKEGFMGCAKWMQEEFLKDLWHPASEKPLLRNGKCLVVYNGKDGMGWKCWCYVSDLFQKEGGEQ